MVGNSNAHPKKMLNGTCKMLNLTLSPVQKSKTIQCQICAYTILSPDHGHGANSRLEHMALPTKQSSRPPDSLLPNSKLVNYGGGFGLTFRGPEGMDEDGRTRVGATVERWRERAGEARAAAACGEVGAWPTWGVRTRRAVRLRLGLYRGLGLTAAAFVVLTAAAFVVEPWPMGP
jgi:hypothetical protein